MNYEKLFPGILLALSVVTYGFSEFQLDSSFGWFFESITYTDDDVSWSINGPMPGITVRYFPITNFGLFAGLDSDITLT